jgi:predicted MFS family arabinose efflux permease
VSTAAGPRAETRPALPFAALLAGYFAVSLAESVIAPAFPVIAADLDLGLGAAGLTFAVLAGSIAAGNVAGGYLLWRRGPATGILAGLATTAAGCAATVVTQSFWALLLTQAVIGAGAGLFFPAGITSTARLAGSARSGLSMGFFGVSFSGGLAGAAVLATVFGRADGWRISFAIAAAVGLLTLGLTAVAGVPSGAAPARRLDRRALRSAIGAPVFIASVGTIAQYGTVSFFALFAVDRWDVSPAVAAGIIAVARVVAVPLKVVVGWAVDRWGQGRTLTVLAVLLVTTGLWWTILPGIVLSGWAVVVYVAAMSGLFPIANMFAVRGASDDGRIIGAYRFLQMAVGAISTSAIGAAATVVGLRTVLIALAVLPLSLLVMTVGLAKAGRT